ncbi:MAG: transporter substrate-binding domain-containing protein [Candidatus Symbiobacter sp.]|nr:transporter substrate-binding domain-containing protein [Candidatus Symbiobacter sp.]
MRSENRPLIFATEGDVIPFNGKKPDGSLYGFEIELVHALCADMRKNCQIIDHNWEGMIVGLKENKFDAIISQIMVTPERLESINFTDSYYASKIVIFGHKGKAASKIEDIKEKIVGAQLGTVNAKYIEDNHPDWHERLFDSQTAMYADFISGRLDYIITEQNAVKYGIKDQTKLVTVGPAIILGSTSIGVNKSNHELLESLNRSLANIRKSGEYDKIFQRYFGNN